MIRRLEANLIDTIAGITPWLAPLIPAFLVYTNMTGRLGYPVFIGLIGACAVEFLGLASVHTAITFWRWNDNHKNEKAPFWIALCAGAFYVVIVLLVNAGLDIWQGQAWSKIAAHALLSLLSVDAAVIIAIRAQHARMLRERDDARAERKAAKLTAHDATHTGSDAAHDAINAPGNAIDASHDAEVKTYLCRICAEGFGNAGKLAAHMRWQHTNGNGHSVTESALNAEKVA